METIKFKKSQGVKSTKKQKDEVEVLYQRLGDRWFAFSLVGDEVFFGEVPADAISKAEAQAANTKAAPKKKMPKAA